MSNIVTIKLRNRTARTKVVVAFIAKHTDRHVAEYELLSLINLSERTLQLLAAAIVESEKCPSTNES